MASDNHKYNQNDGPRFNEGIGAPAKFTDITPEDDQRAQDNLDALIEHTREQLGE